MICTLVRNCYSIITNHNRPSLIMVTSYMLIYPLCLMPPPPPPLAFSAEYRITLINKTFQDFRLDKSQAPQWLWIASTKLAKKYRETLVFNFMIISSDRLTWLLLTDLSFMIISFDRLPYSSFWSSKTKQEHF